MGAADATGEVVVGGVGRAPGVVFAAGVHDRPSTAEERAAETRLFADIPGSREGRTALAAIGRRMILVERIKTKESRRTLELPPEVVDALTAHRALQQADRLKAGALWQDTGLVFTTMVGTKLDAANVRRQFRAVVKAAGIEGSWTPRELRPSFVSLLDEAGVRIESIAKLVGHASTTVTETVYRHELRPVLTEGAAAISRVFEQARSDAAS